MNRHLVVKSAHCDNWSKAIFHSDFYQNGDVDSIGLPLPWDTNRFHQRLQKLEGSDQAKRTTERMIERSGYLPLVLDISQLLDDRGFSPTFNVIENFENQARKRRQSSLYLQLHETNGHTMLFANDGRTGRRWIFLPGDFSALDLEVALFGLCKERDAVLWPHGKLVAHFRELVRLRGGHDLRSPAGRNLRLGVFAFREPVNWLNGVDGENANTPARCAHLDRLEAESIYIMREVVAQAEHPVMLYSIGKDSTVMLHLARKAFSPAPLPFPLLHVDTRWKFQAMYEFREGIAAEPDIELICHTNPEGVEKNINPFEHGSALHTTVMKTEGLIQALDEHKFDVAFGGARRDEEQSRAKERIFSFRTKSHAWEPRSQRPELWNLYNARKSPGESIRVFPLSNWTELDIWQYIYREALPIVPLYFAAERPVVERDGMLVLVDDDRLPLFPDEQVQLRKVRFRTLGCYPLTGAVPSEADTLAGIFVELLSSRTSERQGRAIDKDSVGSMERKKREGYF